LKEVKKKMANEKIVVILLLITIILSVVSVVLTLGINLPQLNLKSDKSVQGASTSQVGGLSLVVDKPKSSTG
jgi:hypothetical protein